MKHRRVIGLADRFGIVSYSEKSLVKEKDVVNMVARAKQDIGAKNSCYFEAEINNADHVKILDMVNNGKYSEALVLLKEKLSRLWLLIEDSSTWWDRWSKIPE